MTSDAASRLRPSLAPLLAALLAAGAVHAADRAAWMRESRWGVMNHFLADWIARSSGEPMTVERWNNLIDRFDVERLAGQLQSAGAGYYIITIGQNSGYYLSPNAIYDRLTGIRPSKCSRRDLVAELYEALHKRGIRLMVYLPSGAPAGDAVARTALAWRNGPYRNREFQTKWEQVVREWSTRWGKKISGWWFDGCFWPNTMYRAVDAPGFASLAAAARSGNPESALAFNPGVFGRIFSLTPHEDYTAGEIDDPAHIVFRRASEGKADGAQIQVLSYLGSTWGMGEPRFTVAQILEYAGRVHKEGGAITWDVPVQTNGEIARPFFDQLKEMGASLEASAPITIVGEFSNMRFTEEHAYGFTVQLWRRGKELIGLFLASEGLQGDTPTGMLEDVRYEAGTGKLSFSAKLTTGSAVIGGGKQEPTRDFFEFQGVLGPASLPGVLKRSDRLRPGSATSSQRIVLRKQKDSGMTEASSYATWRKETAEILKFRGPQW